MQSFSPVTDFGLDAILFDFDGVILESTAIKTDAFRALFADHPRHLDQILALHLRHGGISRQIKFDMIYREILHMPVPPERKAELGARFNALVEEKVRTCPMVGGAQAVLDRFAGRVAMAVVSGTPDEELNAIVGARGLDRYFVAAHGSPPGKAESISRLMAEQRWNPGRVVMVGDAMTDFDAARATGVGFIGRTIGGANPFPQGTPTIGDLTELAAALRDRAEQASNVTAG